MEKLTITKVNYSDKKTDGTPLINKYGKSYYEVGIQTKEYGETWLNGLLSFAPDRWEGSTQELEVYDEEYNGKTYKKFKLPPKAGFGGGAAKFDETQWLLLNRKLDVIDTKLGVIHGLLTKDNLTSDGTPVPDFEPGDVPFES